MHGQQKVKFLNPKFVIKLHYIVCVGAQKTYTLFSFSGSASGLCFICARFESRCGYWLLSEVSMIFLSRFLGIAASFLILSRLPSLVLHKILEVVGLFQCFPTRVPQNIVRGPRGVVE